MGIGGGMEPKPADPNMKGEAGGVSGTRGPMCFFTSITFRSDDIVSYMLRLELVDSR